MRLGAAVFNGDHARLGEEVARLEEAGLDFLHLDVFDGRLIPDLAFPPRTVAALRPLSRLPFEVHLAAVEPLRFLEPLREAGADAVFVHAEGAPMLYETLWFLRDAGIRTGVALGLATPLAALEAALPLVDAVLLLSRVTGESTQGASFNEAAIPRVAVARALVDASGRDVELQVAGGVNRANVGALAGAGADTVALGAGIYQASDMRAEVDAVRVAARSAA